MSDPSPIPLTGLLPHPPIIVPAVGGERGADCRATTEACARLATRVVAAAPARLFLVSPHAPRRRRAYGIWSGERLRGDLSAFGRPGVAVDLPNDRSGGLRLADEAGARGVDVWRIPPQGLDHGSVVPLWFLVRAGWRGPTCVVSLPQGADPRIHAAVGDALGASAAALGSASALVASGDMSHRLTPDAPGGFDPRALTFDERVCAEIANGTPDRIAGIDPGLRAAAGEDVVDSCAVVLGAGPSPRRGGELLSYEHPFGVGYLVAVFHDSGAHPKGVPSPRLDRPPDVG